MKISKSHMVFFLVLGVSVNLSACASYESPSVVRNSTECLKTVWGSSVRVLERERLHAIKKSYQCDFDSCFDAVLSLAWNESLEPSTKKSFDVFMKDRIRSHIVVVGIRDNVDTTEVGIFLSRLGPKSYTLEISSLSTSAKEKVAEAVFAELDLRFEEAQ